MRTDHTQTSARSQRAFHASRLRAVKARRCDATYQGITQNHARCDSFGPRYAMSCLDHARLAAIANWAPEFLLRAPYPWASLQGVIQEPAFADLCAGLPAVDMLTCEIGKPRGHGQQSHDRYALQYSAAVAPRLSPAWREFVDELHREPYTSFVRRMWGLGPRERFELTMHWHYAPSRASVSPHTDARRKIGSHIFYFNTPQDWDPAWGGQTLVLDDGGNLDAHASPEFGTLPQVAASTILGNQSFIFKRTEHSWHAVAPIACPAGRLRKVFIVIVNRVNLQVLWRRMRGKDADGYPLRPVT